MVLYCLIVLYGWLVIVSLFFVVFFFKQKTAYEMRISDWSSDVCSSDLAGDFVEVYFDAKTTANIDNKAATQLAVTTDAVLQLGGDKDVFRRNNADGALEPVTVRTGEVVGDRTILLDGLKPGAEEVFEGAFALVRKSVGRGRGGCGRVKLRE